MANNKLNALGGLFAVFGLGLAIGVLFAPRSGSQTRQALVSRLKETQEKLKDVAEDASKITVRHDSK